MDTQKNIIMEIKKICKEVEHLPILGYHFMYHGHHLMYIPDKGEGLLRFCVPHLLKAKGYDKSKLVKVINETNREVKYVKVIVLDNGSVSLNYDHKMTEQENVHEIVPHIVRTLDFASDYLTDKLKTV
ncbi:hypothetical protein QVO32_16985 [Bacteroides gallinaceum]|uniref:hypothetical protein n=1 Tax=Bacteroides gallinaceum TaxID=1462571 RepID=UPI0025AA4514|nr:hypothetical protein [Bacteroides gallinaceum]MDN0081078.1 hypothetical protein [Bacteroides gallinaceum]